ncbi:MAG TPA: glutamate synthase subunit beta [Candidatus Binatia bacterium]|nr:glutamate synthase subunit beta [Candidatus Binatia bacterium]
MGDPRGFLTHPRQEPARRPVTARVRDWREVHESLGRERAAVQAARCMGCGTPFCHSACPLGNIIPDWNDLVYRGRWQEAAERLHATNNFPEVTGRICPALCEPACVVSLNGEPVTIEALEREIAEAAWAEGWIAPRPSAPRTGKRVAIVGSGPAGLAAAQQLARAGHHVAVYERADRLGGLLRYGIPEFKLEKRVLERRLDQMRAEGIGFETGVEVGVDIPADGLRDGVDAMLLAGGATAARDLPVPGRDLRGVHQAMEYLTMANRVQEGDLAEPPISAAGKRVVIIGGGDTGADCLGTAHRQGASGVLQLEIMPRPPELRDPSAPWPAWPVQLRSSAAHEEGGERLWSVATQRFLDGGRGALAGLELSEVTMSMVDGRPRFEVRPGTERRVPCDLVLLALGFTGPERSPMLDQLGVALDGRGNVAHDGDWATASDGVFVCGDMGRGQSLVVWAIAEGRSAAAVVDRWLMGETVLPSPLDRLSGALAR